MRFNDFKQVIVESQMLTEGYTIGDIAETLWGAAVTAAFEKYPTPATESDVNRIMSGLKNLSYSSSRNDGLKSELTDEIQFVNQIAMAAHIKDVKSWPNSSFPEKRINLVTLRWPRRLGFRYAIHETLLQGISRQAPRKERC